MYGSRSATIIAKPLLQCFMFFSCKVPGDRHKMLDQKEMWKSFIGTHHFEHNWKMQENWARGAWVT
jgi:hypothetical protein